MSIWGSSTGRPPGGDKRAERRDRMKKERDDLKVLAEDHKAMIASADAEAAALNTKLNEGQRVAFNEFQAKLQQGEDGYAEFVGRSAEQYNAESGQCRALDAELTTNRGETKEKNARNCDVISELDTLADKREAAGEAARAASAEATRKAADFNADAELRRVRELGENEREEAYQAYVDLRRERDALDLLRRDTHDIRNHVQVIYVGDSASSSSTGSLFPVDSLSTPVKVDSALGEAIPEGVDALQHLISTVPGHVRLDEVFYRDEIYEECCVDGSITPPWKVKKDAAATGSATKGPEQTSKNKQNETGTASLLGETPGKTVFPKASSSSSSSKWNKMTFLNSNASGMMGGHLQTVDENKGPLTAAARERASEKIAEFFHREAGYIREKIENKRGSGGILFVGDTPQLFEKVVANMENALNHKEFYANKDKPQVQATPRKGRKSNKRRSSVVNCGERGEILLQAAKEHAEQEEQEDPRLGIDVPSLLASTEIFRMPTATYRLHRVSPFHVTLTTTKRVKKSAEEEFATANNGHDFENGGNYPAGGEYRPGTALSMLLNPSASLKGKRAPMTAQELKLNCTPKVRRTLSFKPGGGVEHEQPPPRTQEEKRRDMLAAIPEPETQSSFSLFYLPTGSEGFVSVTELFNGLSRVRGKGGRNVDDAGASSAATSTANTPMEQGSTGLASFFRAGGRERDFVYLEDDKIYHEVIVTALRKLVRTPFSGYVSVVLEDPSVAVLHQALRWRTFDSRGGLALTKHQRRNDEAKMNAAQQQQLTVADAEHGGAASRT
ncbi:unnamed protein product [Amoebophrya sp. A120]|nr:unnamed protein product [Amoebophrya sp. A120]|eukprot:GSA120T00021617001.1